MTLRHIKNPTFLIAASLILALQACDIPHCDTSNTKWRAWESLPVTVSTDEVYDKIISEAILEFNTALGVQVFELVDEEGDTIVSYADFSGTDTLGKTGIKTGSDEFIDSALIYLSYDLDYELAIAVMQHELGHALGRRGHDAQGLMYCFIDDTSELDYTNFIEQFEEVYL